MSSSVRSAAASWFAERFRVFVWFAAGSVGMVWAVFQSPAIDYRAVMLGALLPLVETPFSDGPLHTLMAPTLVMLIVMLSTIGQRLRRRQWLGIPIGMFLHLVLDGSWSRTTLFWWPATGIRFESNQPLVISRGIWSVILELVGVATAAWLFQRFGLDDADRRRKFLRSGQLDRTFVSSGRIQLDADDADGGSS